jgi:NAD(P)-dependent dehydrogenase (short-subunit alcohol dehydrogenase family)
MSGMGLLGQTVVIIGGATGIGLATARRAKSQGAQLIITDRRSGPLEEMADEIGVEATAAFDESDTGRLDAFLGRLPGYVDHVVLSRGALEQQPLPICIARYARREMRDGGSLVLIGERPGAVVPIALPAMIANLAVEAAPVRVNLIVCAPADAPDDVAARALQLMMDPVLTGAVRHIDGLG